MWIGTVPAGGPEPADGYRSPAGRERRGTRAPMPTNKGENVRRSKRGTANESLAEVYGTDDRVAFTDRRGFLRGAATAVGLGTVLAGTTVAQTVILGDTDEVSTATGDAGMVAASQPIATEVGAQVLEQGGNAVDAAVAVQTVLSVVQPHATGIGGGGSFMVHIGANDETYCINSQVRAPAAASPDRFVGTDDDVATSGLAVGVPGTIRGLDIALKRWGTFDLDTLLGPAITLAGRGHPVDSELAAAIDANIDRLSSEARSVFCEDGDPLTEGDLLVRETLADTLERIADRGLESFYQGAIARDIADTTRENGGDLTVDDLAAYNATVEPPLVGEFNGYRITTMQPPSSGGLAALSTLRLVEGFDLGDFDIRSPETYLRFLESSRLALADVNAYAGDIEFVDVPIQGLLSEEYLDLRRASIDPEGAASGVEPGNPWEFQPGDPYSTTAGGEISGGTSHFGIADGDGNVVSCSTTLSSPFGTGIIVPERGILLPSSMVNFDAEPGGPNEIQPGKRPLSAMTPVIVFEDGRPLMAVGSSGDGEIPDIVSQIIIDALEYGQDLGDAITEPRVTGSVDPAVSWEDDVPETTREELAKRGYELAAEPADIGNVQALVDDGDTYVGAADSRRNGSAIGVPRED